MAGDDFVVVVVSEFLICVDCAVVVVSELVIINDFAVVVGSEFETEFVVAISTPRKTKSFFANTDLVF